MMGAWMLHRNGSRSRREPRMVEGMSDTISGSIGDPTGADPDFATDPETEEPVTETPDRDDDDGVEPDEYASPTA